METNSLDTFEAELVAEMTEADARRAEDIPFRILLLGDWSGRANRRAFSSTDELKTWRPLLVDRDNLDQMIARLGVRLTVPITEDGSQALAISFTALDDFHPDRLFQRLDVFESMRRLRGRLQNPKTFDGAAVEVRKWKEFEVVDARPSEANEIATPQESSAGSETNEGGVLDQILAGTTGLAKSKLSQPIEKTSSDVSRLAEAVVKPYLTPDIEADQQELIAAVDARIAATMTAILRNPDFHALESAWRGLDFLVSRLETGSDLKIYLLDISLDEFKADFASNDDIRATALYKIVVEDTVGTVGGVPWAVVAGNYFFNLAVTDHKLVERISRIANDAETPFVAGATSDFLGCDSLVTTPDPDDWNSQLDSKVEQSWAHVTHLESARYVGFALPRFLLRLPYGKETEPTEEFDFEELETQRDETARHESYLWTNPVFAITYLLGKGFSEEGWHFRPTDRLEIEGLPLHTYEHDGESDIKPCAETLLTLRGAQKIIDRGLMPLLSMKESDTIRLGMFQSISGRSFRGRWSLYQDEPT